MKTLARHLLAAILAAIIAAPLLLTTGCIHSTRNSGNQIKISQKAQDVGRLPQGQAVAVNGNDQARQGASGVIVNNFYIGENSSSNAAGKTTDAAKLAGNLSATGQGDSKAAGNPAVTTPPPAPPNPPNEPNEPAPPAPQPSAGAGAGD